MTWFLLDQVHTCFHLRFPLKQRKLVKRLNQEDHSIAHQVRLGLRTALPGFGLFTRQILPEPTDSHWK